MNECLFVFFFETQIGKKRKFSEKEPEMRLHAPAGEDNDVTRSEQSRQISLTTKGASYKLDENDMSPELKQEIKDMTVFYTRPLNPKRDGLPLSPTTMEKTNERSRCFLFYVRAMHPSKTLSLSLCNDADLVFEYISFIKDNRDLKPSTLSRMISVILSVVKFNHRHSAIAHDLVPEIIFMRRLQSQLARESRILAQKCKEGLTKQQRSLYHANILDAVRSLRCKFEETRGMESVRNLHDFVIISLFITVMPGRSKELRTLRVHVEEQQGEFDVQSADGHNYINFVQDGSISVIQTDFKTAKAHGPVRLTIPHDDMLAYYLKVYLKKRPSILLANSHDYFFVSFKGKPFISSGPFSKYVSRIFEREVSIRAGTTALRHAIVTYFNSLEESKDESMRQSLATLMKHTVRYQKTVYDDRSHEERTELGRKFMRERISEGVFADEEADGVSAKVAHLDSEDEVSVTVPVRVNDICCLLDPISTPDNIHIFLSKVARFTPDHSQAYLMHLEELPDSNNLYAFKPGKVWKENCKALIYPVDIVYNSSENAYELRTTKQAIYDSVHG